MMGIAHNYNLEELQGSYLSIGEPWLSGGTWGTGKTRGTFPSSPTLERKKKLPKLQKRNTNWFAIRHHMWEYVRISRDSHELSILMREMRFSRVKKLLRNSHENVIFSLESRGNLMRIQKLMRIFVRD